MQDKYIILDINTKDYFRDNDGDIIYFETEKEALRTCGMYEFENVWICKLTYNYID